MNAAQECSLSAFHREYFNKSAPLCPPVDILWMFYLGAFLESDTLRVNFFYARIYLRYADLLGLELPLPRAKCTPKCPCESSVVTKKRQSRRKHYTASRHSSVSLVAGLGAMIGVVLALEVSRRTINESLIITCSLLALITVSIGVAIVGIKTGHRALHEIVDTWGKAKGKRRAHTGLLLGYPSLVVGFGLLMIALSSLIRV